MTMSKLLQDLLSGLGFLALATGLVLTMVNPAFALDDCTKGGCLVNGDGTCVGGVGPCIPGLRGCGCAFEIGLDPVSGEPYAGCFCGTS